jgi:hypothetical protein
MNYKIAIPTHRRVDKIGELTLNVLKDFDPSNIYLFISDSEDYELYKDKYPQYQHVLTDTHNVCDKFNFVQQYFPDDTWVVVLEDDIKEVQDLDERPLSTILWYMLKFCSSNGIEAFGVYPSSNKFFMKRSIDVGLTYLVANLFGFKSRKTENLNCVLPTKNDYERSVLFYLEYGKMVRFNFVSCKTNNYTNKGGMNFDKKDRELKENDASNQLVDLYPHIFSINTKRKSGFTELKMNKSVKTIKV